MTASRGAKALVVVVLALTAVWQLANRRSTAENRPSTNPLGPGDSVPNLQLSAVDTGRSDTTLHGLVGTGCSIVYFFDPVCPACQRGRGDWEGFEGRGDGFPGIDVFWLSIGRFRDSTMKFLEPVERPPPVYRVADGEGLGTVGIGAVPGVWGVVDRIVETRRTGVESTSPEALSSDDSWCRSGTSS